MHGLHKTASFNINSERPRQAKQPLQREKPAESLLSWEKLWVAKKLEKQIFFSPFSNYTRESGKERRRGVGVTGRKRGRAA